MAYSPLTSSSSSFSTRLENIPTLGMGVSTEYGALAARGSLDVKRLLRESPEYAQVLELGIELAKGLDEESLAWVDAGRPTTYHFLDINLDDPRDFDRSWLDGVRSIINRIQPVWLCGDAGLWHHGPRAQEHMILLPPILERDSAFALADGIIRLREETGLEVFPENPPGHVFVGPLHLLDFFAIVLDRADTGMLLDAAHLTIYQDSMDLPVTTGLDGFPLDRVIELHMAGGAEKSAQGLKYIADDHSPTILPGTWKIFDTIASSLTELRAAIFECERNRYEDCIAPMKNLRSRLDQHLPKHSSWFNRSSYERF